MPTADHGLLGRLDALLDLVTRRRCLFLGPGARLVRADALLAAEVTGLDPPPSGPTGTAACRDLDPSEHPATDTGGPAGPAVPGRGGEEAVEFLRLLAQAVGLLRVRGSRVEATTLCASWGRLDDGLRAGLVYAAWCHRVPWAVVLGPGAAVDRLERDRLWVLRLLFGLPAVVDINVAGLTTTVAERLRLGDADRLTAALAAAFLDPLVALGVADLDPPPPQPPRDLRLTARAQTVIGSALVAAGAEMPFATTPN
jgi:hypothetical protein